MWNSHMLQTSHSTKTGIPCTRFHPVNGPAAALGPSLFLTELRNSWPECSCRAGWHEGECMSAVDTYSAYPNPTVFWGTEVLVTEGSG